MSSKKEKKNMNQTIIDGNPSPPGSPKNSKNNMYAHSQINYQGLEYYEYKIILLGEAGVGKTSIMYRFTLDKFKNTYLSTIGVEYKARELNFSNSKVNLKIWDTAGQERFRSITKQFFKNSDGVFLIFDLCNKDTIKKLNVWLKDIAENAGENCIIFLIGNKMDVKTRDISISEEAKELADNKNIDYYEVSAKTGNGVANIFEKIAKKLVEKTKIKNKNEEKKFKRNLNIEDYTKEERGKVEQNRNSYKCC